MKKTKQQSASEKFREIIVKDALRDFAETVERGVRLMQAAGFEQKEIDRVFSDIEAEGEKRFRKIKRARLKLRKG